jgi:hypothetical protein
MWVYVYLISVFGAFLAGFCVYIGVLRVFPYRVFLYILVVYWVSLVCWIVGYFFIWILLCILVEFCFYVSIDFILLFYLVERASSFGVFFSFASKIGFLCGFSVFGFVGLLVYSLLELGCLSKNRDRMLWAVR